MGNLYFLCLCFVPSNFVFHGIIISDYRTRTILVRVRIVYTPHQFMRPQIVLGKKKLENDTP